LRRRLGGPLAAVPQSGYAGLVAQPLAVERTRADGYELLAAEGEIDVATSPRLIAALNEAVTDSTGSLVIDLSAVGFMDSTGLASSCGRNGACAAAAAGSPSSARRGR
jgi:anti-sigma B factor antagonist